MSSRENLSEEELKALHECANEAFFQRSLPLITVFGGGTYIAVRTGKLNPHYKWGATPKVVVACGIAYFIGQISYSQKCRQKLMDIPDSKLGKMLRRQELGMHSHLSIPFTLLNQNILKRRPSPLMYGSGAMGSMANF